ncbi:unnamed protein product [Schistosoma curassoni]|uniref:G_PROTEIN_RECEP_F1_2 domain-containing protein n=1 Tax=Schistosoma curassoni TaxID=6186 RepID=A0A183KEV9_9TREM|nr:unnamed protein product [Schistosoma curassoni]
MENIPHKLNQHPINLSLPKQNYSKLSKIYLNPLFDTDITKAYSMNSKTNPTDISSQSTMNENYKRHHHHQQHHHQQQQHQQQHHHILSNQHLTLSFVVAVVVVVVVVVYTFLEYSLLLCELCTMIYNVRTENTNHQYQVVLITMTIHLFIHYISTNLNEQYLLLSYIRKYNNNNNNNNNKEIIDDSSMVPDITSSLPNHHNSYPLRKKSVQKKNILKAKFII